MLGRFSKRGAPDAGTGVVSRGRRGARRRAAAARYAGRLGRVGGGVLIGNSLTYKVPPLVSLEGMLAVVAIALVVEGLKRLVPRLPMVLVLSVVATVVGTPGPAAVLRRADLAHRQAQLPGLHHAGARAGRLLRREGPAGVPPARLAHRGGVADRHRRYLPRRDPDRRVLPPTLRENPTMYRDPEIAEDTRARMRGRRRDIHANPETAFEEHLTANVVANALMLMGLPVHRDLAGTGVVGTLSNGDGPSIALRADLDALNMQELGTQAHASKCVGKMHACGHDGHTAMLLGAAELPVASQTSNT